MSNVFGPVPSRRLGRSLGIDLVPFKTCTYDCIYCQLGRTTNKIVDREEWFPLVDIVAEVREKLDTKPDYITLSGSGEPMLYSRMGDLIEAIRSITCTPIAVLTNGSMLRDGEVRRGLACAHRVIPSLDAGDDAMFQAVNRPHPSMAFEEMVEGLVKFREEYAGAMWLEVFIVGGYTSVRTEAAKIAEIAGKIGADRVQLNTVTRPPSEEYAAEVPRARMREIACLFNPAAEIIAEFRHGSLPKDFTSTQESVLDLLRRRPCSIEDIAGGLGLHRNEALKYTEELLVQGNIVKKTSGGKVYYLHPDKKQQQE